MELDAYDFYKHGDPDKYVKSSPDFYTLNKYIESDVHCESHRLVVISAKTCLLYLKSTQRWEIDDSEYYVTTDYAPGFKEKRFVYWNSHSLHNLKIDGWIRSASSYSVLVKL